MKKFFLFLLLPCAAGAQCQSGYKYVVGLDCARHCIPVYDSNPPAVCTFIKATSLPSTCSVGDGLYLTQTDGSNAPGVYKCDTANMWTVLSGGAGAVSSVFTRTGAVVSASGDYTASQITNAIDSTQTYNDPLWIATLAYSKLTGAPATGVSSVFGRTGAVTAVTGDYSGNYSLASGYLSGTKIAGSGGTTANLLVKIDSTGNVVTAATSDVGILGIAVSTVAAGATLEVATRGIINCVADNTTVIGNIAIVGTSTAGRCRDSGQTNTTLIGPTTQVVGKFLSAVSAGSNASLQLYGPGHYGSLFATVATSGLASDLTGTLADARLSANVALYNGTTAFTTAQAFAAGALTTPSIYFSGSTQTGFYQQSSNRIAVTINGTLELLFPGGEMRMKSAEVVCWSSGSPSAAGCDTGLSRISAGVISAGTGAAASTAGTFRGSYQSSDGTAGVTVTTCTGFKNGLCISGT